MAGVVDEAFEEDATILEEVLGQPRHRREGRDQRRFISAAREADAATAGGRFQHHRIAEPGRRHRRLFDRGQQRRARRDRHAGGFGECARLVLQAKAVHLRRRRAAERQPGGLDQRRELGVLGEEAVAWDDRLGALRQRGFDDPVATEIGLDRGVAG